jgi:hypothetical protein
LLQFVRERGFVMSNRSFAKLCLSAIFCSAVACASTSAEVEADSITSAASALDNSISVGDFRTACESCTGCSVFTETVNNCTVYKCGCDSTAHAECAADAIGDLSAASIVVTGTGGGLHGDIVDTTAANAQVNALEPTGSGGASLGPIDLPVIKPHKPTPGGHGARCGGLAPFPCYKGLVCIDEPNDSCDPKKGGADCTGVCVTPAEAKALGSACDAANPCPTGLECTLPPSALCNGPKGVKCSGVCTITTSL